jgi:rhodanese-related sulfurtransferase
MRASILALLLTAGAAASAAPPSGTPAATPAAPASSATAAPAAASAARPVTADALLARQRAADPSLVVLDVRTPEEFAAGHVPGAVNVPHDQVEARLAELAPLRNKDVVVYCRSGKRAGMALGVLEKAGFRKLGHLEGDYTAWSEAGRPTEKP